MTKYQVRSKELIDLVNEIKSKRLIMAPYFQRKLVWRLAHKVDFIKTILLTYPFPQIFIAKGTIDLDTMTTTSCIVDGQQRMNSIVDYVNDCFAVDGVFFTDLDIHEKESFLKYQVPIIDLDINNDDPQIKDIFQRLNRTFYALSGIEKLSSEYASSEFMLLAKSLTKELKLPSDDDTWEESPLKYDPSIPESFIEWAKQQKINYYTKLIIEEGVFSAYELTRQIHLNFTLNLISTSLAGFYNRNDFVDKHLDTYANEFNEKNDIVSRIERAANKYLKLKLKKKSYWYNKANVFSLMSLFMKEYERISLIDEKIIKERLEHFETNITESYRIAAKEGVNNKQERLIRDKELRGIILSD